jgi:integrase
MPRRSGSDAVASDIGLADAVGRFVSLKTSANAATADKYRSQCRLFIRIIEGPVDRRLSSLSSDDLRRYVDALQTLPKKVSPSDPRSMHEIMITDGPKMAPKTRTSHAHAVNMFLEWCSEQGYAVPASFRGILKPLLKKPKIRDKEKSFSLNELRTIFGAAAYREGTFGSSSKYWLPLLALFTGARQAELCQLHHEDVRQDPTTAIWIFDFNAKGDKQLKQRASQRTVPIHPQLIAMGFLDYLEAAKALDRQRVFPDLQRNERGEFNAYSKRFNRFLDALNIRSNQDAKKDFHSFRHSLGGLLTERGIEEYVVNAIIGHSQAGRSESVRTYSGGVSLTTKRAVIEKIDWDIDFAAIATPPAPTLLSATPAKRAQIGQPSAGKTNGPSTP